MSQYSIIINTGEVYKGNTLIAPCQDANDPLFLEYKAWVENGNIPTEYISPSDDYEFIDGEFRIKLNVLKQQKMDELSKAFEDQFQYGKFMSSLGFEIDNRRYGDKNDKDNIQSLIDIGITIFKDASGNFHNLTVEQLQLIKLEMTQDGLKKYQTKWYYEALIFNAQDIETLNAIQIIF